MLEKFATPGTPGVNLLHAHTRRFRKGETIIHAGSEVHEWIAISKGVVFVSSAAAAGTKVAVATLWSGDIVGRGSPLGASVASYDVQALVDVETIALSGAGPRASAPEDLVDLYTATAARLNRQIAVRLAGNGPQRLVSALATLGSALFHGRVSTHHAQSLPIPVGQAFVGQLSGLSRRQVWTYIGKFSEAGWIQTSRTSVTLQNVSAWLAIHGEVNARGLRCIATIATAIETLERSMARGTGV